MTVELASACPEPGLSGGSKDYGHLHHDNGLLYDPQAARPSPQNSSEGNESDSDLSWQEDEEDKSSDGDVVRAVGMPVGLASSRFSVGDVCVKNSNQVFLGNRTHFHGPVTVLKQILVPPAQSETSVLKSCEIVGDNLTLSPLCSKRADYACTVTVADADDANAKMEGGQSGLGSESKSISKPDKLTTNSDPPEPSFKSLILRLKTCPLLLPGVATLITLVAMILFTIRSLIQVPEGEITAFRPTTYPPRSLPSKNVKIISRKHWLAQPVDHPLHALPTPVEYILIHHSAADFCFTRTECAMQVRQIQTMHIEGNGWWDIGYNFLVGGDGSVFEGRGWDSEGAHTFGWNKVSLGICFIGTFKSVHPPMVQQLAAQRLIELGVRLDKVRPDYKIVAYMQVYATESPGKALFDDMKSWPHWINSTELAQRIAQ